MNRKPSTVNRDKKEDSFYLVTVHGLRVFTVYAERSEPMTERIFNFSAGPAVLPVPVLERAREEMLSLPGVGMSVMEISHRSKPFQAIIDGAEAGVETHGMDPVRVLATARALGRVPSRIRIVACEPGRIVTGEHERKVVFQ